MLLAGGRREGFLEREEKKKKKKKSRHIWSKIVLFRQRAHTPTYLQSVSLLRATIPEGTHKTSWRPNFMGLDILHEAGGRQYARPSHNTHTETSPFRHNQVDAGWQFTVLLQFVGAISKQWDQWERPVLLVLKTLASRCQMEQRTKSTAPAATSFFLFFRHFPKLEVTLVCVNSVNILLTLCDLIWMKNNKKTTTNTSVGGSVKTKI